jgi:hypothetical protein
MFACVAVTVAVSWRRVSMYVSAWMGMRAVARRAAVRPRSPGTTRRGWLVKGSSLPRLVGEQQALQVRCIGT